MAASFAKYVSIRRKPVAIPTQSNFDSSEPTTSDSWPLPPLRGTYGYGQDQSESLTTEPQANPEPTTAQRSHREAALRRAKLEPVNTREQGTKLWKWT